MGETHLKKILQKKEYGELLDAIILTPKQKKAVLEKLNAKSGKAALAINTILTSALGAWMGLHDFFNNSLENRFALSAMLVLAVLICGFVGYFSFKSSNEENLKSIQAQKLNNLKICCASVILRRRKVSTNNYLNTCNNILKIFYKNKNWESNVNLYLTIKSTKNEVRTIKKILCHYINKQIFSFSLADKFTIFTDHKISGKYTQKKSALSLRALIKAPNNTSPPPEQFMTWALKNRKKIFITFLPVLFGVFASSFVYLAGVPHMIEEYHLLSISEAFQTKLIKWLSLAGILCMTVYFSYISVQSIYRAYKRSLHLIKTEAIFSRIENNIFEISKSASRLKKLLSELESISLINLIINQFHKTK